MPRRPSDPRMRRRTSGPAAPARGGRARGVAAEEVILDPAVVIRLLAGRSGGDPTSERGELEGLWEVTEGEAVRGQLGLEMRAADASFEGGQVRRVINV